MTNAELIAELTYHANIEKRKLLSDAADALEADEQRISELSLDCELFQQKCMELGAQLPKEGEWIKHGCEEDEFTYWECPFCGFIGLEYHYCPNCGARMRKGEEK